MRLGSVIGNRDAIGFLRNGTSVNVEKGIRRLALLLGILGALVGLWFGYGTVRILWGAHVVHERFSALFARPAVQKIAREAAADRAARIQASEIDLSAGLVPKPSGDVANAKKISADQVKPVESDPYAKYGGHVDPWAVVSVSPIRPEHWEYHEVNDFAAGIEGAEADTTTGTISEVSLFNGETVRDDKDRPLYAYTLALLYPLGGFLFGWLMISAIAWVWAGFNSTS